MKFYLGMNYNNNGIQIAKEFAQYIENTTGDKCISRWHNSKAHQSQENHLTIALTDALDIAQADYVILCPLTPTSRGTHVEQGLALALDKPTYLYRPPHIEGTAFDSLCKPLTKMQIVQLNMIISMVNQDNQVKHQ